MAKTLPSNIAMLEESRNSSRIHCRVDASRWTSLSARAQGSKAAKQATKTIPIVMVTVEDPVANGFIDSLAHPAAI